MSEPRSRTDRYFAAGKACHARWPSPGRVVALLASLLLLVALVGCAGTSDTTSGSDAGTGDVSSQFGDDEDSSVEIPDVVAEDGAGAVSDAEDAGLETELADGTGKDLGFDSSRDPSGCEVTDQDPAAGESAADGDVLTISLDCRQTDWDNEEGSAWDAYNDAYSSAFDDGCQELFDTSPNGSLYKDDVEYTVVDCQNLNPGEGSDDGDLPADVPDDPDSVGQELGETAGCRSLFDEQGVGSLNYGTDSVTADDCPVGVATSSSASPPSRRSDKSTKTRKSSDLYRVSRDVWDGYDRATKLRAARYFLQNNPHDCGGRGITPQQLVDFADAGGLGDTRGRRMNEVMIVLCSDPAAGE